MRVLMFKLSQKTIRI